MLAEAAKVVAAVPQAKRNNAKRITPSAESAEGVIRLAAGITAGCGKLYQD